MKTVGLVILTLISSVALAEEVNLTVTEKGFQPKELKVKSGEDITLNITRKTDDTCATKIQIPSMKIKKDLPLNKPVTIALGKLKKGHIKFGCGMNMMDSGFIIVE